MMRSSYQNDRHLHRYRSALVITLGLVHFRTAYVLLLLKMAATETQVDQ